MIRIIGGAKRGLKLLTPASGDTVRPTSDKLRGAIFNILLHADWLPDFSSLSVLDVFAGTGALGLEALSRGAADVSFIESDPDAQRVLSQNIKHYGTAEKATLLRMNAVKPIRAVKSFDLIFLDPPYGQQLGHDTALALRKMGWTHDNTILVVEMAKAAPEPVPDGFVERDRRAYGKSLVAFWTLSAV